MQRTPVSVGGQQIRGAGEGAGAVATARDALAFGHERARSLYVHVPFCFHKCHYCDFYSFVDSQDRQEEFVETLERELAALAPHAAALRTVFVGGGTPSLLRPAVWERLLGALRREFDLAPIDAGAGEFTVECNPETVTAELMDTLRRGGVNRVSVGAQSFDAGHLKTLERWHEPASVGRALGLAAAAGVERRSLDLIFAIPGQSVAQWERDLETALAADPGLEHLSAYALTYEPNTPMTARLRRGEFVRADEDLEAEMFERTNERMEEAGLARYEVSNFARPGGESLHNLAYWRGESWLAAGPSASGHLRTERGGVRWKNVANLREWSRAVGETGGYSRVVDLEAPDPRRSLAERLMMGLRLAEGVDAGRALEDAGALGSGAALRGVATEQERLGLLEETGGRWRLTARGFLQCDGVAGALMGAV